MHDGFRRALVEEKFSAVAHLFRGIGPPPAHADIAALLAEEKYGAVLKLVKTHLRVDAPFRLLRLSGPPDGHSAMAIRLLPPVPPYGTDAFRATMFDLLVSADGLRAMNAAAVACGFAHETMHALLAALGSPLFADEEAVDTAIAMCGYAERMLASAGDPVPIFPDAPDERRAIFEGRAPLAVRNKTYGYLSRDEILHVADLARRA